MLNSIKNYLKDRVPILYKLCHFFFSPKQSFHEIKEECVIRKTIKDLPLLQKHALLKLKDKEYINCVFFVTDYQSWKYDGVYKLLEMSKRFNPTILICPPVLFGKEKMLQHLNENVTFFGKKGYKVIKSYEEETDQYVDVRKELSPDIIFFPAPYKGLMDDRYYITHYLDILTVYVPYAFNNNVDYNFCLNLPFHNYLWRYYAESDEHKTYSVNNTRCKGRNVVSTGYPGIEPLLNANYKIKYEDWKNKNTNLKRIIWAPHHTISPVGLVNYSCFIRYADFMLHMADKYQEKVQFVFKPHPMLKDRLDLLWGKTKADEYYNQWKTKPNCNFNDGEYVDLFLGSDAMIHDCGSFLIEYLYVNKPVMRTMNSVPPETMYNPYALKCLDNYYLAYSEQDIESFIQNVINGIDPLKSKRTNFVNDFLMIKDCPSQNIIDDLTDSINNQRLY